MSKLPSLSCWLLALLAVLLLPISLLGGPEGHDIEVGDDDLGEVADFSLTDRSGRSVTREDLLGKVWIASFVLTRCPDGRCPQVTQTVKRLQDELAGRRNLLFVTFTVDPDRDDQAELARYAERNGADPERWFFLTGKEETIEKLLRSFHFPAEKPARGQAAHSQKLVLVDRHGHIRGLVDRHGRLRGHCDGLAETFAPEGDFENGLRLLKHKVDELLAPELPDYLPKDFPAFNASLNAIAGVLVLLGYLTIRNRQTPLHVVCMLSALAVSAVFLASYLFYHLVVKEGRPTRFSEQAPDAPEWVQYLYLAILLTHTVLAVVVAPLALFTAYQGLRGRIARHVRIARWTLPMWLYVSTTGVVVYWMLYRLYPAP